VKLDLEGKVGIVTGASRGIGRAVAETLAGEGVKLVLVARSRGLLESLAASLPVESLVEVADLREPEGAARAVEATVARFGRIDLVVNVAGATKRGDFLGLTDADWADGYALKLFGAMRLCRASWPHLVASRGSIVNIAGIGGRTGSADFTIGGSVNAALLNLTKALADRGVADGVRVNAVNPGSTLTERLRTRVESLAREESIDFASAERKMAEKLRVARFGDPSEVARAVAFLASPAAAYCQGVVLDVDGGATRTL
jgi:3-oxoacyl-[acyl-carrier protein] reductase